MKIIKNLFGKTEPGSLTYDEFWQWFTKEQDAFFKVVHSGDNIESAFLDKLSPQLNRIRSGYFFLTGMTEDSTAELVITADANLKNMVFVEDLIAAAPSLDNWKFTAHKPEISGSVLNIEMDGVKFGTDTISFKPNTDNNYPDLIDITLFHKDFNKNDEQLILNGSFIFLDNFLGEIKSVTAIDSLTVEPWPENDPDLVPIEKIKDYIIWREKEFVEKYEGLRYDTENDGYSSFEAQLEDGSPLIAIINTDLIAWDAKASHPWGCILTINYDGATNNGLPTNDDLDYMNRIEDEVMAELKDSDGYLNVGRQTGADKRDIYFSCKDFREPSRVFDAIEKKYEQQFQIEIDIFKDKYWTLHNRFMGIL